MTEAIDSHLHYWQIDRGDYGWLTPELGPLYRDHLPPDAEPHLTAAGIDGIVLVQAAPTEAETRFLLDIAKTDRRVRGVVGWIDMTARDAPDRLAALAADPMLKSIRPMWQDLPDDDFMHRPEIQPVYRALVELGLRFDALAKPRHLPLMPRLLEKHPDLALIVDHGAKPDIAGGGLAAWKRDLREVASHPHVFCKLSGSSPKRPRMSPPPISGPTSRLCSSSSDPSASSSAATGRSARSGAATATGTPWRVR